VIIDSNTLATLVKRQLSAGLAEAIKMALNFDSALFELIEKSENLDNDIDKIIEKSLKIKRDVVEKDAKESSLRRVLNFGHTIGHAIESHSNGALLHGECVGLGMLYMSSPEVKEKIKSALERYSLPTEYKADASQLMSYVLHDKKMSGKEITVIFCNEIGTYEMKKIKAEKIIELIEGGR
jgi:3-dehydroquinate synthase